MIELHQMSNNDKEETSLFYKIIRGMLMLLSGVMMFYYLLGIANYITSGPSETLLDDLTTEFVVQTILLGIGLFYLIVAWFKHIEYSIVALIFTFLYVAYSGLILGVVAIGFLPIAMAIDAAGFICLGLYKKHRKKRDFDVYAEPIIKDIEGPDIFNFRV